MITINCRKFLSGASPLGFGLLANGSSLGSNGGPGSEGTTNTSTYRIAFNAWIKDVRNKVLPFENWPLPTRDDETVESNFANFDLFAKSGYNSVDIFGLLTTYA